MKIPKVVKGKKRFWSLKQKAQLVAAYDPLPKQKDGRGFFTKKYHLHWNMLSRWRAELWAP